MGSNGTSSERSDSVENAERLDDMIENPVHGESVTFLERARDTDGEFVRFEIRVEPGALVPRARSRESGEVLPGPHGNPHWSGRWRPDHADRG